MSPAHVGRHVTYSPDLAVRLEALRLAGLRRLVAESRRARIRRARRRRLAIAAPLASVALMVVLHVL